MIKEGQYCYSTDGDCYYGEFETYDEALKEALKFARREEIKIGQYDKPIQWEIDGELIFDQIAEHTEDQYACHFDEDIRDYMENPNREDVVKKIELAITEILASHPIDYAMVLEVRESPMPILDHENNISSEVNRKEAG